MTEENTYLVLSRKAGEAIIIGDQIKVTITQIKNGQARIGISAPRDINIRRDELPPK